MGKILFWALLIIGVLLVARILARHNENSRVAANDPNRAGTRRAAPAVEQPEAMVRCAHCGIHMPRSEAVLVSGQTWCSEDHARLGVRQQ